MKKQLNRLLAAVTIALVALAPACEDTEPSAPTGSTITLTAQPANVTIDFDAGESEGQSTIIAQVVDPNGLPLDGIPLVFTSTGGLLGSAGTVAETNSNGVATDVLTLRLNVDPSQVTVTAKGTNLEGMATVSQNVVNLADPVPIIVADPAGGGRTGVPFFFDGTSSTHAPNTDIECYDWTILSNKPVFDSGPGCTVCSNPGSRTDCEDECTSRGPNSIDGLIPLTVGTEGNPNLDLTLSVALRVSQEPTIACDGSMADDPKFGPNIDAIIYEMECDRTDPTVQAGGNQTVSINSDGDGTSVSVTLNGVASDPEDVPPLDYQWDCGSGGICSPSACDEQSVSCTYSSEGVRSALLTVTNDCNRVTTDAVQISVQD